MSDLAAAPEDAISGATDAVALAADVLEEAGAALAADTLGEADAALDALADEATPRDSPHPGSAKAAAPTTAAPVKLKKERLFNIV